MQETFLKKIGQKHPIYNFSRVLSRKYLHSIFNQEMICVIFESLLSCRNGLTDYMESACDILLVSIGTII
jgi:sister-chromatid-cohesion protein PDS5